MHQFHLEQKSLTDELLILLQEFLTEEKRKYPEKDLLKIDLHCHDYNSDVPDEILGRILNIPETWLKTEELIEKLKQQKCDVFTITNHNNARSCYELIEKGIDVIVGCEFSCYVPDYDVRIHVLAYDFNEQQEETLLKLKRNIYLFQEYCNNNDIPTIWAHPFYYYSENNIPPIEFFEKMILLFERFEIINGQRSTWQNMLFLAWLKTFNEEKISELEKKFNINSSKYCKNKYRKVCTGGSDCHSGLFVGQTGSYLYVENLQQKLKYKTKTQLAIEAIKQGNIIPYGTHCDNEKLTISLLDYALQIAINYRDPGLLRIILHKGSTSDKIIAFLLSNCFAELKRHKTTMRFIKTIHKSFKGVSPSYIRKHLVSKSYKPVIKEVINISKIQKKQIDLPHKAYDFHLTEIHKTMLKIFFSRLKTKISELSDENFTNIDLNKLIEKLELPSDLHKLFKNKKNNKAFNFSDFIDGLTFPAISTTLLITANFISARVLNNNRVLLNKISNQINRFKHPRKALWLTDTFEEKNGVSSVLKLFLTEIQKHNIPIDILVCSDQIKPEPHLIVVNPQFEYQLPFYTQQNIRIPDLLEIHKLFQNNEYDRIICSTEGIMGWIGIYLKKAFSVKSFFYMHTDWITFARKVYDLKSNNLNRLRRFLRAFYKNFDAIFVLNTDHLNWLTSKQIELDHSKVFLTAHWIDNEIFKPLEPAKEKLWQIDNNTFVVVYAGRLSKEKGVMELPEIYNKLTQYNVKFVIVGSGPAEKVLKELMPEAIFMGWIENKALPLVYSSADVMIFPSKFDTFSCAVLEALSCGTPVIAYNTKGPKDLITDGHNGFLSNTIDELIDKILWCINNRDYLTRFKENALNSSLKYKKDHIFTDFCNKIFSVDGE